MSAQSADEYRKKHNEWNRQRRDRNRQMVADYKAEQGCQRCREEDPRTLVFHHRNSDEKVYNISTLYRRSQKIIWNEIDKCDVLCQNCHQIVEYEGYDEESVPDHKARKRAMVHEHQSDLGCIDCGETDPIVLMSVYEDERDGKREAITKMVLKGRVINEIEDALERTYTVCRNCYSKREVELPGD